MDLGFNTQPPEGGCSLILNDGDEIVMFQHTAARRRLPPILSDIVPIIKVSTHSRPKAAANRTVGTGGTLQVSTHSRPKAAA